MVPVCREKTISMYRERDILFLDLARSFARSNNNVKHLNVNRAKRAELQFEKFHWFTLQRTYVAFFFFFSIFTSVSTVVFERPTRTEYDLTILTFIP